MKCHTLMSAKQRVQNHFRDKSTSDLTLLVDFYDCYMRHGLTLKVWEQKLFILLLGAIYGRQQGTMLCLQSCAKIDRVLMVHPLILFRIC